jgi:hypothetical protein
MNFILIKTMEMKKTYATFLLCAWGLMQSFSAMAQDEAFQPAQISQTEFEQLQSDNELSKRLKISIKWPKQQAFQVLPEEISQVG